MMYIRESLFFIHCIWHFVGPLNRKLISFGLVEYSYIITLIIFFPLCGTPVSWMLNVLG